MVWKTKYSIVAFVFFSFREKLKQKKLMAKKAKQESKNQAGMTNLSHIISYLILLNLHKVIINC